MISKYTYSVFEIFIIILFPEFFFIKFDCSLNKIKNKIDAHTFKNI